MSLLIDMMSNTLDASYAEAAARRAAAAQRSGPPITSGAAASRGFPIAPRPVAVLVLLLLLGAVTGTAARQVRHGDGAARTARLQLLQDVRQQTADTDALSRRTKDLRASVGALRDTALGDSATAQLVATHLTQLGVLTGALPVRGPGVVLTLDDARGPVDAPIPRGGAVEQGRVQDRDLQDVVNGLWAAGAEAISINGLRLTALTAIRSAGEAILVDFRPLTPPYVVAAIGDRNGLQSGFGSGAAGGRLATLSSLLNLRYSIKGTDNLLLVAAGLPDLRLAQPGETS